MLSRLKKNISILLIALVGVIYLGGLFVCNWINYTNHLNQLKADVREEIREYGWNRFLVEGESSLSLEGISYCVFQLKKDSGAELIVNHFPQKTESQLMKYGECFVQNDKNDKHFITVTYIIRVNRKYGACVVLISGEPALRASLPAMGISAVAGIIGVFALFWAARVLSRWLVHPVEDMVISEKQFLSNASHELKTPLTVIRTNAELLQGEIGDNKHLQYICLETERMTALVNRMLTLVRLDSPVQEESFVRFRADEALLAVIYPMEGVAYEKKLRLEVEVAENIYLTGNEEQIKSLVSILLDNAINYSPEGGCILIQASLHSGRFCLKVENTGEEIPERTRRRLFERFYRQDDARTGTENNHFGLGLSIAQSIVSNHHGQIRVDSRDGQNCFTVTLPASGKL